MCKNVKDVLDYGSEKLCCTIEMDGKVNSSEDFVAVLGRENGDASLFYNTDALTLGMAIRLLSAAYLEALEQLSEEERSMVEETLGDAFIFNKPKED